VRSSVRAFVGKNPSFALFAVLVPGLLLVEAGAGGSGLGLELICALLLARARCVRAALALAALACLLLGRGADARSERLAEVAAWRGEGAGPLALTGRAEAQGHAGRGRTRFLFRVEAVGRAGAPAAPRTGWVRLYSENVPAGRQERRGVSSGWPAPPPVGPRIVAQGFYRPGRAAENPGTLDWGSLPGGPRVRGSLAVESWRFAGADRAPAVERLRERLSVRIASLFPPLSGGFMQAALLGDRENLDPRLGEVFTRTGTGHIIAISGMNVAILAAIGWAAMTPFVSSLRRRRWLLACGLLLYIPLGGSSPSVARAALMGVALLCAQGCARHVLLPNALGAAGLLLLALQPGSLLDPSFQLSFAAVLGLALLPTRLGQRAAGSAARSRPPRAPRGEGAPSLPASWVPTARRGRTLATGALDLVAVTAVSLIATLPFTLAYFRHLPLLSLPANLVVVPALGALTAGGLAALLSALVWTPLGELYARACDLLLLVVFRVLELCARPDWAWMALPGRRAWLGAGGLCLSCLAAVALRSPRWRILAGTAAGILALAALAGPTRPRPARPLEAAFLAVGQGDAVVLLLPGGEALLVDGGPARSADAVVGFLHERGVLRLERIFATHPDADHVGALAEILERVPADSVHDAGQWGSGGPYRSFLEGSYGSDAGYRALGAGERLRFGEVTVDVLWPPAGFAGRDPYWEGFATNDASLVLLVGYRGLRLFLAGDVGGEVERGLAAAYGDSLASGFLKVSHHGSRSSSATEFLAEVGPAVALVSAGRGNRYGHPHAEALARLAAGARIWRTDHEGALLLSSDGHRYELRGYTSGRVERGDLDRGSGPAPAESASPTAR
jgi:competence protein ComEC